MEKCDSRFQFGQSLIGGKAGKPTHQRDVLPGIGIRCRWRFAHISIVYQPGQSLNNLHFYRQHPSRMPIMGPEIAGEAMRIIEGFIQDGAALSC
jgi:hypothetical protein